MQGKSGEIEYNYLWYLSWSWDKTLHLGNNALAILLAKGVQVFQFTPLLKSSTLAQHSIPNHHARLLANH